MRNVRFDHWLAGTMLALATGVVTATPSIATPDGIRQVAPLPPSLNGARIIHRRPEPMPEPPPAPARNSSEQSVPLPPQAVRQEPPRHETARQESRNEPRAPEPARAETVRVEIPRNEPLARAPAAEDRSFVASALDRVLGASDAQIAERLRGIVAKSEKGDAERKAIAAFYAARNYAPLWIRDGRLTAGAKTAILRMKNAQADALEPADYAIPNFDNAAGADQLAAADVKLTHSALTFARHLAVGRIAPTRVTAEVDYGQHAPDNADVLRKLADARDANTAFDSFEPPQPAFRALKRKLAELRAGGARADADERIAGGPAIKPGDKDPRVPQLRQRLNVRLAAQGARTERVRDRKTGRVKIVRLPAEDPKTMELVYDKALFNAVKHIQARADIKPTGVIDNRTIAAINGPSPQQQIDVVMANMERWRWLPRDLGRNYVMVNIPDYTLKVVKDGSVVWRTKIVAGKPQTPTPLLTAAMDNVVVNPSWYVPQSIIQNELLPAYASDPNIFDRMGLEVKRGPDGHINVVQPPGMANALGRIKFNFPNKYQVYLHDTPEKRLFAADRRAFSHGCMRVENPTKFGEVMLAMAIPGQTPTQPQIERLVGQDEKIFKMVNRPMVHLTYQTAFVDDDGKLELRDDIYGFDKRIHTIMTSDERRIADVAPPQDKTRDAATMKSNQEILSRVERREAGNPFQFFEKIFR
ncbi:MAG: L,D-transpeptidase family protein [Proteobacteria bacterium]|nr:L,D-transpeptidase family protein [Pseudomonadota bacterium]